MTNEEYYKKITPVVEAISSCSDEAIKVAAGVLGKNMIPPDFCLCALIDRSIRLSTGFVSMLNDRNLTCAGALLRLQLDNCLRFYAINIADNELEVITTLFDGGSIGKLKDKNGKKMTDGYIKEQMEQYDNRFSAVYDNASGYIHFSAKAIYQSIYEVENNCIRFQVGGDLAEKRNGSLLECANAYLHYYRLFLQFMKSAAEWKRNFDESMEE